MMKCETTALQRESEMVAFIELLKKENVRSYLEIGGKFGGSLWRIGRSLPAGSRIVSVDLPHGQAAVTLPHLQQCVSVLSARGYDTHLIVGDSTDPKIIEQVKALGPFDVIFIDANHTLPYVTADWQNYKSMGRIIAFHDIGFFRAGGLPPHKTPIDVPQLWTSIKGAFRHIEIRHDPQDNGIGIIWV